jgi:hypothetical protein
MRAALLLTLASVASAQIRGADAPNPEKLGQAQEFKDEGIVFRPIEGSLAVASDGAEGQRVIGASRMVTVDGREAPLGVLIEVFRDLDFGTWVRMAEGAAKAAGRPPELKDLARRHDLPAWRADLPQRDGPSLRVLALDAGDRVVVVQWTHAAEIDKAFGILLAECAESVKPEARERKAPPAEPTVEWSADGGPTLKHPDGWTVRDSGRIRSLLNPGDRFEVLSFGTVDKSLERVREEWEALLKAKGASAKPIEGSEVPFGEHAGFACRSMLVRQGIEVVAATRFVRTGDTCFFVLMTARADRWEERRAVMDAIFGTIVLPR